MTDTPQRLLWYGVLRLLGLAAVAVALLLYTSYEARHILDRWSLGHVAVTLVYCAAVAMIAVYRLRPARDKGLKPHDRTVTALLDAGVAAWGIAYLLDTIRDPSRAVRLFDLHLYGSVDPLALVLEWWSLLLAFAAVVLWTAPRAKGILKNVLLSAFTIAGFGLVGEGFVRGLSLAAPEPQGMPTYRAALWTDRYASLNSAGFRGPEPSDAPSAGARTLAVIGDSFAFGTGVKDIEERIGESVGRLLSDSLGEDWQVLNISRPDTHTMHHIDMLDLLGPQDPNLLLLIYVFNDIDYLQSVTPRTVLTEHAAGLAGRLHPARIGWKNSFLFQQLYVEVRSLRYALRSPAVPDPYLDPDLLARHMSDVATFVSLAATRAPTVCVIPFEVGLGARPVADERYRRFIDAAEELEIPVCGINDAFAGVPLGGRTVNRHDAHPNARAHGLAARAVLPSILSLLRLEEMQRAELR
jgi:hypothetical protein